MNKAELVSALAERNESTKKEAEACLDNLIDIIQETVANDEKISLTGFGVFEARRRKAREGRNPRDPEQTIQIPATVAPAFKAGKTFKETVAKKLK